jgi:hypothetical protein
MIAVAALAVAAGSASAQTLRADIPFTFRAGRSVLTPGTYKLNLSIAPNREFISMQNTDTGVSVLVAAFNRGDASTALTAKRVPALTFDCNCTRCALRELWTGVDSTSYHFRAPHLGRDGDVYTAEIALRPMKAD